uniref:Metabotropic glutamate receptor 2/3 n=1 Tax=Tetraselmis sp. GSL018 TaxID=582737 RepID=A0A061S044_9CHLO
MRAAACQYCGLCLWLGNLYALASQITCILVIGLLRPPVSVAVENLYPVAIVLPAKGWPRTVLGAYLAVKHINECNNSVVQEAANICDSFKIKEVFVDSNFSPTGAVLAGNKANEINAVSVIGAIRSAASIPLAHVLSTTATPIVSPASASATLSSNTVFPLFSRVVPSNTESSKALARLVLVEFGWRKVAVLHQDDSYGSGFYQDFVSACRQLSVEHLNLTLADYEVSGAPVRQNHVEKSLAELKDRGYHVFCLVLLGDSFPLFFRSAAYLNMFRTGFTYITTDFDVSNVVQFPEEHGFDSPGAQRELSDALQGFLRVQFSPVSEPSYSRLDAAARAAGAGILPEEVAEGIAAEGKDPDEWMSLGLQGDVYSLYAYDAVWTVALALRKAERSVSDWSSGGCGSGGRCNGAALNRLIRSASFGGASGEVRFTSEVDDQGNTIHLGDRDVSGMDSLVQFYDNRTMAWVDAGRLGRGGYAAEREIVWPGMVEGGVPPDGRSCPAGAFFDEAELECRPCGAGAFRPSEGGLGCRPCPAGTFCDTEGCEVCSPCPIGSYQSGPGSTGCAICPSNTQTSGQGASSVGECRCVPGYYRRDGRSGEACYPCPDGGQCVGGAHPPYPRQGYWGDWSLVDSSTADSEEAAARIHKLVFHECAVQEDCTSEVREADLAEARAHIQGLGERSATEAAVMAEALRAVRSNASRVCSGRTEGVLCASCARGYYNLGGRCRECLRPYGVFVSGCIGGIILAWYLINRIMAGKIEAVDLTLIFFQNASTIGSFSLDWSEALERGPFNVLGILNFDVDFFNPDCLSTSTYTAWSYGHALVLQLLLPLAVAAALALFCLASTAAVRLREALAQHQVAPDGGPQGAGGSAWRALGLFGIATSREGIEAKKDSAWATVASFVNVIYHTLTLKCLEVFRCEELPDGSSFLSRAPGVECGTAYHRIYMAMGVLGLVVYSVGIPLAFMVILEYGRVHDLFSQERFSSRFGWLYLRYEKDWYFWELVIMARRVLLVAILVFAPHLPSVQILLGNAVICMAIAGHFYARPFIRRSTDQLEMVSVAALFGVLSTGILFNDANAQELYPVWEDVVTGMSCLFLFSGLFFVVNIVVREAITSRKRFSTGSQLRHLIMETLRNHCPVSDPTLGQSTSIVGSFLVSTLIPKIRKSCDLPRGPSKQRSAESDNADGSASPLSESGAEDKAKELRAWKKIRDSLSMEPLELNNTLDPAQILKWLSKNKVRSIDHCRCAVHLDDVTFLAAPHPPCAPPLP